jgi:putative phage-type endonuclease
MSARMVPTMVPGGAEWMTYMSASKIAAVMGLSPYESRFSLWHRMCGQLAPEPQNDAMSRGHYLEPGIRAWFKDQHPELWVEETGTWINSKREWQSASPDGLIYPVTHELVSGPPNAILEIKTANDPTEWGKPGTDEIPVGYRCQVIWQMDTLGIDTCHVAVLTGQLQFVEYVVRYNANEAQTLRAEAESFMASLESGVRPDLDAHSSTYAAVKALHPDIEPYDVEISLELAREFCLAKSGLKTAKDAEQLAVSRMADTLGNRKRARFNGQTIASRQAKGEGIPYLVTARNLPDFTDLKEAS